MKNADLAAEQWRHDKELRARIVLDQLPLPIYTVDNSGRLNYFNLAAIKLWGRTSSIDGGAWSALQRSKLPKNGSLRNAERGADVPSGMPRDDGFAVPVEPGLVAANIRPHTSPLLDATGAMVGSVNVLVEHEPNAGDESSLISKTIDHCAEDDYVDFFENAVIGLQWCGSDGTILKANRTQIDMLGYSEAEYIGRNFAQFFVDPQGAEDLFERLLRGGSIIDEEAVVCCKDGSLRDVSLSSNVLWRNREFAHTRCMIVDITERKRAEQQAKFLALEVNHRAKNLLAVVLALVRHTAPNAPPGAYADCLEQRIAGLAASHDLVSKSNWRGVRLDNLIRSQLPHLRHLVDSRIRLFGPDLVLKPAASQAIGMAVHELATNAGKYGSLSGDAGTVDISWGLVDAGGNAKFNLCWREFGGAPLEPPVHRGFGHIVTVELIRHELQADVEATFREPGFCWRLECDATNAIDICEATAC